MMKHTNVGFNRHAGRLTASLGRAFHGVISRSYKPVLLALGLFAHQYASAQSFSDMSGSVPIVGVTNSSVAWGDYDNDNDLDILISGSIGGNVHVSKIYTNLGAGRFSELTSAPLTGLSDGSASWGDYDNDGDLDILLTGHNGGDGIAQVYTNQGGGNFALLTANFSALSGYGAWGDYDNDGDLDIFLTGRTSPLAHLYVNQGGGQFVLNSAPTAQVTPVSGGSLAWGDYDNDNDLDIAIEGFGASLAAPKLYANNGAGVFVPVSTPNFKEVAGGNLEWSDYDNDGDLDLLHTGRSMVNFTPAAIYKNNGGNNFSVVNLPSSAHYGAWGDFDNDGDLDVILQGYNGSSRFLKIFKNNGNDAFVSHSAYFVGMQWGAMAWGDYDKDNDIDVLVTGTTHTEQTKLYRNNASLKNAMPVAPGNLSAVVSGSDVTFNWSAGSDAKTPVAGLSYNLYLGTSPHGNQKVSAHSNTMTGYRKIAVTGNTQKGNSFVIKGLTPGTYYWSVQSVDAAFAGSAFSAEKTFVIESANPAPVLISFSPAEGGQGDAVTLTGQHLVNIQSVKFNGKDAAFYISDDNVIQAFVPADAGTGKITVVTEGGTATSSTDFVFLPPVFVAGSSSLTGVTHGDSDFGDYDNDGDLDIILMGSSNGYPSYTPMTKLYQNNGGNFSEVANMPFVHLKQGAVAFGDYDRDNDADVVISGRTANNTLVTKLYKNTNGTFEEVQTPNLIGVTDGSLDWGDFNNDGNPDLLLTGDAGVDLYVSKIYKNNGNGTFSDVPAGLIGVALSSAKWFDHDKDGDLDLVLAGADVYYTSNPVTRIYTNNGNETFSEAPSLLLGVMSASIAVGDYDDDADLDLLVTGGRDDNNTSHTVLYKNNGNGNFTGAGISGLISILGGQASFGNFDNMLYDDILLAGTHLRDDGSAVPVVKMYRNMGNGQFKEAPTGNISQVYSSLAMWGDVDNDKDLDLLISGRTAGVPGSISAQVYLNTASFPNFYADTPAFLSESATGNAITLSWYPSHDTHRVNEYSAVGSPSLSYNVYVRRADGTFVVSPQSSLVNGYRRVVDNGNADFSTKFILKNLPPGTYYWSVQAVDNAFMGTPFAGEKAFTVGTGSDFTEVTPAGMTPMLFGTNTWGDLDNDGDLDLVITGRQAGSPSTRVYLNQQGSFTELAAGLVNVERGAVALGDMDNDGDLDIAISGKSAAGRVTQLYLNSGNGSFTALPDLLPALDNSMLAWGDFDNDGDLDLALAGKFDDTADYNTNDWDFTKLFRNNGNNSFSEVTTANNFKPLNDGTLHWGDFDNDGDLDLLAVGKEYEGDWDNDAFLYKNNGDGTFSETSLGGIASKAVAIGDADQDGDLDIFMSGIVYHPDNYSTGFALLHNNGDGTFGKAMVTGLPGVVFGSAAFGDYEGDGDLDLLISGREGFDTPDYSGYYRTVTSVYLNHGNSFTELITSGMKPVLHGAVSWADYDNDGDLDAFTTGQEATALYRNNIATKNTIPSAPAGLNAVVSGNEVNFSWNAASDAQTAAAGLTYNLYVGTSAGDMQKVSPHSAMTGGFRRVVALGNANHGTTFKLKGLADGTYYWSVQAIDNHFAGSAFAAEGSFTAGTVTPPPPACATPANLGISNVTRVSARGSWEAVTGVYYYTVRFREVGATTWRILNPTTNQVDFVNLLPGKTYEWQVRTRCSSTSVIESDFSALMTFTTESCPVPMNMQTSEITHSSAVFNWEAVADVQYYSIRFRAVGSTTWRTAVAYTNSYTATSLMANQMYEWQIRTRCQAYTLSESAFSPLIAFKTNAISSMAGGRREETPAQLSIYPNPSKGEFNVELLTAVQESSELQIYNAVGKLVYKQTVTARTSHKVHLESGFYTARILADGKVLTQKFVVE